MPRRSAARVLALEESAAVFAALGDPTRLRLVSRLCAKGPMSIARLTDGSEVTRQAITKHVHLMEGVGLLRAVREGREQLWELDPRRLEESRRYLDVIAKQWDGALGRLKRWVES